MDTAALAASGPVGSITGGGNPEIILLGAIAALVLILLFFRFLRGLDLKRRKKSSTSFERAAGTSGGAPTSVRSPSIGPTFSAPRKGSSNKGAAGRQPARTGPASRPSTVPASADAVSLATDRGGAPLIVSGAPAASPATRTPVNSPILDPVPPLSMGGPIPDQGAGGPGGSVLPGLAAPGSAAPGVAAPPTVPTSRTAVPANLPPMAVPPSAPRAPDAASTGAADERDVDRPDS